MFAAAALALAAVPIWSVSPNNALLWDGVPYAPVGVRLGSNPAEITAAAQAGIKDFVVELSADGSDWAPAIQALKAANARYMIAVASAAPAATVYTVEPGGYRRTGLVDRFNLQFRLPGVESALAVLISRRDGTVRWSSRLKPVGGVLSVQGDPKGLEQILALYPLQKDLGIPDVWEGLDQHRDRLLRALKANELGAGFRGLINPMGRASGFPGPETTAVPASPLFQMELEQLLTARHKTLPVALRAWGIGMNDIESLQHLARLVPLWTASRGASGFWDPVTDKTYTAETPKSSAWRDIRDAMREAFDRRYSRLVAAIRQAVDCPILQDFDGWHGPYAEARSGLNGIGFRLTGGRLLDAADDASRPVGASLRAGRPSVVMATDGIWGGTDRPSSPADLVRETESMGVRGWFFRAKRAEDLAELATLGARPESGSMSWKPSFLPFPDAARNPCAPARLGGGMWWLPSPGLGQRLELGSSLQGYRYEGGGKNFIAIWSRSGETRVRLKAKDPKALVLRTLDGSDPKPRITKSEVEVTIGPSPLLIENPQESPAPLTSFVEITTLIARLFSVFELRVDAGGAENLAYRDALQAFQSNPGQSLTLLGAQLNRLAVRVSPYIWAEAELIRENSFSDIVEDSSASGGRVLALDSRLAAPDGGFSAKFTLRPRTTGVHEVWVAARMSDTAAAAMSLKIGSEVMRPVERPVSPYGIGFAWRKLGSVDLGRNDLPLEVRFDGEAIGAVALDAIMITPGSFSPDGPRIPLDWLIQMPDPRRGGTGLGGRGAIPPTPPASSAIRPPAAR